MHYVAVGAFLAVYFTLVHLKVRPDRKGSHHHHHHDTHAAHHVSWRH